MMINSLSSASYNTYAQLQNTQNAGQYGNSNVQGPDLDTNSNGSWSTEEIEEFSTYAAAALGTDIDTDEIMSTYDVDGDGSIDADERTALGEDNAFNLTSPQDMMNQMRGFSPPPNIQPPAEVSSSTDTESTSTSDYIEQILESYTYQDNQVNYQMQMQIQGISVEV